MLRTQVKWTLAAVLAVGALSAATTGFTIQPGGLNGSELAAQAGTEDSDKRVARLEDEKAALKKQLDQLQEENAALRRVSADLRDRLAAEAAKQRGRDQAEARPAVQLEEAMHDVELKEAQLAVQKAMLEEVAVRLESARRQAERVQQLAAAKAGISQQEVDQAMHQLARVKAQLRIKEAELRVGEVQLKHARQRLGRLKEEKPGQ